VNVPDAGGDQRGAGGDKCGGKAVAITERESGQNKDESDINYPPMSSS